MIRRRASTLLLALAALAVVTSCDEANPTSPLRPVDDAPSHLLGDLMLQTCQPLPADTVTEVIGPSGGALQIGPHTLTVPAGALDSSVTITAIQRSTWNNRLHFAPQGLEFSQPALLEMSYANCAGAWIPLSRKVVYIDSGLNILEILLSLTNFGERTVTGEVDHFSDYAVAW
jgi:hypothetical protein